jgi:hypothetical protein
MTADEQFAAINTSTFMNDLITKAKDTLGTLSSKQLQVDKISFPVSGVMCTVFMPKGGQTAHITLGVRDDQTPIVDMPQVPVAWVTPTP